MGASNWLSGLAFRVLKISGVEVSSRAGLNLVPGAGLSIAHADDAAGDAADVTVGVSGLFETTDALRSAVLAGTLTNGQVVRTLGQDNPGDGMHGEWVYCGEAAGKSAGTYTDPNNIRGTVIPNGDGSEAAIRISGKFVVNDVADDAFVEIPIPVSPYHAEQLTVVGTMSVYQRSNNDHFPQLPRSVTAWYDFGSSPQFEVGPGYASSSVTLTDAAIPTGTTGTDARINYYANDGAFHIENRIGDTVDFIVALFD